MKLSDIVPLGDGVYELERGVGDQKLELGDRVELLAGGIVAGIIPNPHNFRENDDVYLPSSLDEDKLMTLSASYEGVYDDDRGVQQYLCSTVLKAVQSMREGQKVFIIDEIDVMEEIENARAKLFTKETGGKRMWVIKMVKIFKARIESFPDFRRLAIELQDMIWAETFSQPRFFDDETFRQINPQNGIIYSYLTPSALYVCHDSQKFALSRLRRTSLYRLPCSAAKRQIYFNPDRDVFQFRFLTLYWSRHFPPTICPFKHIDLVANVVPDQLAATSRYGLQSAKFHEAFPHLKSLIVKDRSVGFDDDLQVVIHRNGLLQRRWREETSRYQSKWDLEWEKVEKLFKERKISIAMSSEDPETDQAKKEFMATFSIWRIPISKSSQANHDLNDDVKVAKGSAESNDEGVVEVKEIQKYLLSNLNPKHDKSVTTREYYMNLTLSRPAVTLHQIQP